MSTPASLHHVQKLWRRSYGRTVNDFHGGGLVCLSMSRLPYQRLRHPFRATSIWLTYVFQAFRQPAVVSTLPSFPAIRRPGISFNTSRSSGNNGTSRFAAGVFPVSVTVALLWSAWRKYRTCITPASKSTSRPTSRASASPSRRPAYNMAIATGRTRAGVCLIISRSTGVIAR